MDINTVFCVLTTYKRTDTAIRTVEGVLQNMKGADCVFLVYDDGSKQEHRDAVREAVGSKLVDMYNGERRGVGHGMNWGISRTRELGGDIILMLEDDWLLHKPLDISRYVNLLHNNPDVGMVRLGYLGVDQPAKLSRYDDRLWWELLPLYGYQYVYAGHASIRHLRLHDTVGMFREDLAPGYNEMNFCGRYNATKNAPKILWDTDYGPLGPFAHIGTESMKNEQPGQPRVD